MSIGAVLVDEYPIGKAIAAINANITQWNQRIPLLSPVFPPLLVLSLISLSCRLLLFILFLL